MNVGDSSTPENFTQAYQRIQEIYDILHKAHQALDVQYILDLQKEAASLYAYCEQVLYKAQTLAHEQTPSHTTSSSSS